MSTNLGRKIARYTFIFRIILTLLGLVSTSFWLLAMFAATPATQGIDVASPFFYLIEAITKLINYSYAGLLVTLEAFKFFFPNGSYAPIQGNFLYSFIEANEYIIPGSKGQIDGSSSENLDISLRPNTQGPITLTSSCESLGQIVEGEGVCEGVAKKNIFFFAVNGGVDGVFETSGLYSPEGVPILTEQDGDKISKSLPIIFLAEGVDCSSTSTSGVSGSATMDTRVSSLEINEAKGGRSFKKELNKIKPNMSAEEAYKAFTRVGISKRHVLNINTKTEGDSLFNLSLKMDETILEKFKCFPKEKRDEINFLIDKKLNSELLSSTEQGHPKLKTQGLKEVSMTLNFEERTQNKTVKRGN